VENTINTGWLDCRIAANVKMEQPPWELSVIGAAAVRAHEAFACKAAEYLSFLAKGQLPPADISLIFFQVGAGGWECCGHGPRSGPASQGVIPARTVCKLALTHTHTHTHGLPG
jgi:hypothetical protein